MAKKKATTIKAARATKEGQEALTLAPDYSDSFSTFYANFAYVSHTNSEIMVDFCLVSLPYSVDLETKEARVPVVCRIIIPPLLVDGLMKALKIQQEKQQATAQVKAIAIPISGTKKV